MPIGALPRGESSARATTSTLPWTAPPTTTASRTIVRGQIDVTTGGSVKLKLNSADALQGWIDNAALEMKSEMVLEVKQGVHTLTSAIGNRKRSEGLRMELGEVAGSGARVQFELVVNRERSVARGVKVTGEGSAPVAKGRMEIGQALPE